MSIGDGLALLAVAFLVVGGLEVLRRALADRFNQKCAADDRGWNYRGFHGGPFDPATLPPIKPDPSDVAFVSEITERQEEIINAGKAL